LVVAGASGTAGAGVRVTAGFNTFAPTTIVVFGLNVAAIFGLMESVEVALTALLVARIGAIKEDPRVE